MGHMKSQHSNDALPLPDEKLERDHYYWDVIFLLKEGYVGYGSYIIDATSGVISQSIRLDCLVLKMTYFFHLTYTF